MIRILGTAVAAGAGACVLALSATPATAQAPVGGRAVGDGATAAAATCRYVATESVRLRAGKTSDSTGLKLIPKGGHFSGPCVIEYGQRLGDCLPGSQTDILWTRGRYDGAAGWVFTACTRPA